MLILDIVIACLETARGTNSSPMLTRIRLMPVRVTCWQSYSSRRSRPRQFSRCSRATSVMRRQLSSSSTRSLSWPQVLLLRCRIPSSVMSSQWDRLWKGKEQMFARPSHSKAHGLGKAGELGAGLCSIPQHPLTNRKIKHKALGPFSHGFAAAGQWFLLLSD